MNELLSPNQKLGLEQRQRSAALGLETWKNFLLRIGKGRIRTPASIPLIYTWYGFRKLGRV